jgi:hypothetical protein
MKDETLKLALDDLMVEYDMERASFAKRVDEIFKQATPEQPSALALDKMAENARDLGLDYEPAPVQPAAWESEMRSELAKLGFEGQCPESIGITIKGWFDAYAKSLTAQPAVPDAFGTREGEHPQYVQGWNDCRAETLKMRKP